MNWTKALFLIILLLRCIENDVEADTTEIQPEKTTFDNVTYKNGSSVNGSFPGGNTSRFGPPGGSKHSGGLQFLFKKSTLRVIPLYLTPPMILFGLIGNILSLLVLLNFVKHQKSSSDVHLCALAIFDIASLIFAGIPFWMNAFLRDELDRNNIEHSIGTTINRYGVCQSIFFASAVSRICSVWMIVLFTIERYFFVKNPFTASDKFTVKRAFISTGILILVAVLISMYKFWAFDKVVTPNGTLCKWSAVFFIGNYVEYPLLSLVPGLLIVIFNILTIKHLVFHREEDKERERQVTRRVLAVSITFLVLTLPFMVLSIWRNTVVLRARGQPGGLPQLSRAAAELFSISQFFFICNHCVNFILYCCTGSRFRIALKLLLNGKPWTSSLVEGSKEGTPKSTRSSLLDINNAKDNSAELNSLLVKALHNRRRSLEALKVNAV